MGTDDTLIRWTKRVLGLVVFVVAMSALVVRKEPEPYGVMAAMYAICAASMLFIASVPTGKAKKDKIIDRVLHVTGIVLAFFSGGFWLKGELDEGIGIYLRYLALLVIMVGLLTVIFVLWLRLGKTIYNMLRTKFRNRSR